MDIKKAENLAISLIEDFKSKGLIEPAWKFAWNRRKRAAGLCSYTQKTIYLSEHYVLAANEEQVRNTILHEICHTFHPGEGHSKAWKLSCIKYGCKPQRCANYKLDIPAKYSGTCPNCLRDITAHRRLKNMNYRLCAKPACIKAGKYVVWSKMHN